MKKIFKVLGFLLLLLLLIVAAFYAGMQINFSIKNSRAKAQLLDKKILTISGLQIRDLNNNGEVDPYEDPRQPVKSRVENLLEQMTIEEKVGLMFHPPIGNWQRRRDNQQTKYWGFFSWINL
jgi:beta-glucosidase